MIFDGYVANETDVFGEYWSRLLPDDGRHRSGSGECGCQGVRYRDPVPSNWPMRYAQRSTFGKPIAEHQAIAFQLAEMAAKVEAAHLADGQRGPAERFRERNDLAAGMAKYFGQRVPANEVTQQSFRIHGGYYPRTEIERLMRDAPSS